MKYSTKEIVDMAVKIEDTGYTFYTECARKFGSSSKASDMFLLLANEELKHRDYFQSMLDTIPSKEGIFEETYFAYLKALTQAQVFRNASDIPAVLASITDIKDILKIALQTEKDSIIWYKELDSFYGEEEKQTHAILNELISEEKRHIVLIYDMMNAGN